ncbi:MAG: hypothetical protein DWQ01_01860 [Planctomycetota bacterium]|nr:MAG: hypothetical protein DWQ01_01860 [Planctomycetota bacterium]
MWGHGVSAGFIDETKAGLPQDFPLSDQSHRQCRQIVDGSLFFYVSSKPLHRRGVGRVRSRIWRGLAFEQAASRRRQAE